jgi:hypothetical protein
MSFYSFIHHPYINTISLIYKQCQVETEKYFDKITLWDYYRKNKAKQHKEAVDRMKCQHCRSVKGRWNGYSDYLSRLTKKHTIYHNWYCTHCGGLTSVRVKSKK